MTNRQMGKRAGELKANGVIGEFADMSLAHKPPGGTYNPDAPKKFLTQYQNQFELSKRYSTQEDSTMLDHLNSFL